MVSIAIYCSKLLKKIVLNVSDCSSTPNPWGHQKRIHHQSRTRRHPIWPQQSSLAIRSGQLGQQATTTRSVISPQNLVQLATPPRSWTVNENFAPRGLQIYQLSTTQRCVHKQQIAISEDFDQNLAGHPQPCALNPLVGRSRSTRCGNRWAERTLARCLTRCRVKITRTQPIALWATQPPLNRELGRVNQSRDQVIPVKIHTCGVSTAAFALLRQLFLESGSNWVNPWSVGLPTPKLI